MSDQKMSQDLLEVQDIKVEKVEEEQVAFYMESQECKEVEKYEEEPKKEIKKEPGMDVKSDVCVWNPPSFPMSSKSSSVTQLVSGDICYIEDADESSVPMPIDSIPIVSLEYKVECLVKFLLFKYQSKEFVITEKEMLANLIGGSEEFPVIFQRASKTLQAICGIDMKEVDHRIHSYVIFNSLNFTCDRMVSGSQYIPKSGLLVVVLGVIFTEDNCASEEAMWNFLDILGIAPGIIHFLYGEPRKLLTRDWVEENYLEYRQVPNSDPLQYEFLWGPRAYAEISKFEVMLFLLKIKMTEPTSFLMYCNLALSDEEKEKTVGRSDSTTAM